MGYAERESAALRSRLSGLWVAVDVQHLYRDGKHAGDMGSVFELAGGAKLPEAQAVLVYAQAAVSWLAARGASVLTNNPVAGTLTGPYGRRHNAAAAWGAHAYLACHLNAGGGSYALAEYMVPTGGQALGVAILGILADRFQEIRGTKINPLMPGQRGAVCIAGLPASVTAIVLEPFFGDNALQQPLLSHDRLVSLGEAVGEGVAAWWASSKKK